ncbi:Rpp14/Pop5 family protein [Halomicroarcula sp. GCM10025709]|uniref:Rpp14/Pop5 family protein n=1 Tax=Haloarcula TaxID=2237 RepID=UPI0024C30445|nr:Rpp14/Pop5 family protein [Halomicroarcula sp. YJ-61-S]
MKHLPKHLRPRWRYLAVGIESWPDAEIDRRSFQRSVWYAAQNLLGDVGSAAADMNVVEFAFGDGAGHAIVRVRRAQVDEARAALAALGDIDGAQVGIRVRGTSGTMRACEEKYIRGPAEPSGQRQVVFEDVTRDAVVRGRRVDVRTNHAFAGATELDLQ